VVLPDASHDPEISAPTLELRTNLPRTVPSCDPSRAQSFTSKSPISHRPGSQATPAHHVSVQASRPRSGNEPSPHPSFDWAQRTQPLPDLVARSLVSRQPLFAAPGLTSPRPNVTHPSTHPAPPQKRRGYHATRTAVLAACGLSTGMRLRRPTPPSRRRIPCVCLSGSLYTAFYSCSEHPPAPVVLLYCTVPVSTVQYSTVQYSTVQYSTVQYSTVQYSTVQYSTVVYCTRYCTCTVLYAPSMYTCIYFAPSM
jgi:hypothetical protein